MKNTPQRCVRVLTITALSLVMFIASPITAWAATSITPAARELQLQRAQRPGP